jgi:hypothetical protein
MQLYYKIMEAMDKEAAASVAVSTEYTANL